METSNLYFIHFPKMSALKIGKADDIEGRYNNLKNIGVKLIYPIPIM